MAEKTNKKPTKSYIIIQQRKVIEDMAITINDQAHIIKALRFINTVYNE